MNTDRWSYKHLEQLLDFMVRNKKLTELSATKTSTCNDLVAAGFLAFGFEDSRDYLHITERGKGVVEELVHQLKKQVP